METNSGVVLDRIIRSSACGTWWSAATPAGFPLGLLQLEPELFATAAARDRAAATVDAVRAASLPGVVRTGEFYFDARRAWVVVASVPRLTVTDLLHSACPLPAGCTARIAVDVAQALRGLHRIGLSHGDLAAESIAITPAGEVALIEVGLFSAVQGRGADVGRDSRAWARLARQLTVLAAPAEAQALTDSAAAAELGGLALAVAQLTSAAEALPHFYDPAGTAAAAEVASTTSTTSAGLRVPAPRVAPEDQDDGVRIRFGPGVPAEAGGGDASPRRLRSGWLALAVLLSVIGLVAAALALLR